MIKLHKLQGGEIVINAELIESLESGPSQTVVSLSTGNRFLVSETLDDVRRKAVEYRREVNSGRRGVGTGGCA